MDSVARTTAADREELDLLDSDIQAHIRELGIDLLHASQEGRVTRLSAETSRNDEKESSEKQK